MNYRQGTSRNPAIALAALAAVVLWVGCSDDPMRAPDTDVLSGPLAARFGSPDIVVPPGGSIQAALDGASPGDVIHIEPGMYTEAVTVAKSGIKLVGLSGSDGAGVVIENPGG